MDSSLLNNMPLFIVMNAGSGHGDSEQASAIIRESLQRAGREHQFFFAARPADLNDLARRAVVQAKAAAGAVVGAGGDGTLNTVAQAAFENDCPFGVLPQGTFNYFGRTHGIPENTAEAVAALLDPTITPAQVGLVNGHVFLVSASVGLYPRLIEDREAYKQQLGRSRLVALLAALVTLLRDHRPLSIRIEREGIAQTVRTATLFAGNNRLQLEQIGIPEADSLENARLAAIALRPVGLFALLVLAARGVIGQLGSAENIINFAFQRMEVKPRLAYGRRQIKVAIDGEIRWLRTPLIFQVAPRPLQLLGARAVAARV